MLYEVITSLDIGGNTQLGGTLTVTDKAYFEDGIQTSAGTTSDIYGGAIFHTTLTNLGTANLNTTNITGNLTASYNFV